MSAPEGSQAPLSGGPQSLPGELATLHQFIIEAAQIQGFLAAKEIPYIPELQAYQKEIVSYICLYIKQDMTTKGLTEDDMVQVFQFVFRRAMDAAYQWLTSPDGTIDATRPTGNPFTEPQLVRIPAERRAAIESLDAPRILCRIMTSWWIEHGEKLQKKGIDIWHPLSLALMDTFGVGVALAQKMFAIKPGQPGRPEPSGTPTPDN